MTANATAEPANVLADTIETIQKTQADTVTKLETICKTVEDLKKPAEGGVPGSFAIRKGENPNSSRPYSLMRLAKALSAGSRGIIDPNWRNYAKTEINLSDRLRKAYYGQAPSRKGLFPRPL